ncbi:MAG: DNA recombination protein RmuC [Bacteroidia bacterium]|nr:DNA recombination protein RmuC [Bacteroidia bacterium]
MEVLGLALAVGTLVALVVGLVWLGGRLQALTQAQAARAEALDKLDATLRAELQTNRSEQAAALDRVAATLKTDLQGQLLAFGQQLGQLQNALSTASKEAREAQALQLKDLVEGQRHQFGRMTDELTRVGQTIAEQLKDIRQSSEQKLEQMRQTVDEKLHATLEQRLGESFKLVSDRLEQVHKGLGEMQSLASGVSDLKNVLANVKTRGTFGETQLEALLEQLLTPDQYALQQAVVPTAAEKVDAAIRLPGAGSGATLWLPVDAKFPLVEYEALVNALAAGDVALADYHRAQLLKAIRTQAKDIQRKYVQPPHTTDFALLFLPIEGLFAEVLREPGLFQELQAVHKVVLTGPTTLSALLSSLRMGFRTLAIEKRSAEVWKVLGAVKAEFGKFGDLLTSAKKKLEGATKDLEQLEGTRSRAIQRQLREVEALPEATALPPGVLPTEGLFDEG